MIAQLSPGAALLLIALIIAGFVLIILDGIEWRRDNRDEKHDQLMRELRRHKNEE